MNFREIAGAVMDSSRAEETEVLAMEQDESLTRFAQSVMAPMQTAGVSGASPG